MKNKLRFLLLSFLALLATVQACRNKKNTQATTGTTTGCKLDYRLPKPLMADMRKKEFSFEWLSTKLECEAASDSSNVNFGIVMRMRRDSIIWLNITDAIIGIKVARVRISTDSVFFVNYLNNTCFRGDFAYLSQLLQTEVDFELLQSMLVGNSVGFYEEDEKLRSSVNQDDCNYTLSTVRKRKLRKVNEGQFVPQEDPIQTISLDPQSYKIIRLFFLDAQNRSVTVNYSNFELIDSLAFPRRAEFKACGNKKTALLNVTYGKINLNQPQQFPFTFPDDCNPIIIDPNKQR